jgi:hypothetical protein
MTSKNNNYPNVSKSKEDENKITRIYFFKLVDFPDLAAVEKEIKNRQLSASIKEVFELEPHLFCDKECLEIGCPIDPRQHICSRDCCYEGCPRFSKLILTGWEIAELF